MPAITLGLAEVEERLRALQRRLNLVTAQHSAYLAISLVLLVAALLIFLGLRTSASVFRIAAWGGMLTVIGVAAACAVYASRHWLDVRATAHLADDRGQLTDRLATLVDLHLRPRPSRLAPVLVAQTLALGTRWQAQSIAPRRIPRSVFLLVAAFLALATTAFVEREPSPPASAPAAGAGEERVLSDRPGSLALSSGRGTTLPNAVAAIGGLRPAGDVPPADAFSGSASNPPVPEGGQWDSPAAAASNGGDTSLADRLQRAIHRALRPQPADKGAELGRHSGNPSEHDERGQPGHEATRRDGTEAGRPPSGHADGPGEKKDGRGSGSQMAGAQRDGAASAPQTFQGASPAAGEGSSPQSLLAQKETDLVTGNGESPQFKLMIPSSLRPVERQDMPRQSGARIGVGGPAADGSGGGIALSDRQLTDDALRKAEIPPEYEELVRRVYSLRARR